SSDVCSSDLHATFRPAALDPGATVEPQPALRLAHPTVPVGVLAAVAVEAPRLQDREDVGLEVDLLRGGGRGGQREHRAPEQGVHANSSSAGRPLSATVNGRPSGEVTTCSSGRPSACAIVALKSGIESGRSTISRPSASVLP